jgi:hypothetical protein
MCQQVNGVIYEGFYVRYYINDTVARQTPRNVLATGSGVDFLELYAPRAHPFHAGPAVIVPSISGEPQQQSLPAAVEQPVLLGNLPSRFSRCTTSV